MTSPQSQHCTPPQRVVHDDEIDLKELLLTLWAGKATVVSVILLTIVCAAAYVFFTPAIYQASVTIAAPAERDVLALAEAQRALDTVAGEPTTINKAGGKAVDTAFKHATELAESPGMLQRLLSGSEFEEASSAILHTPTSITVDAKKGTATLTRNGHDAKQTAANLNQYAELLISTAQQELAEDIRRQATVLQNSINNELNSLRQKAVIERQQTIAKLSEALALAESLNMEDPATHGNIVVPYSDDTTYMRGASALRNQIKLLKQRASDDDFIPEFATIAEYRSRLKDITLDASDIQAARIDVPAATPTTPIKPRKALIMAVSVILGGMLGVFIVLVRHAFKD